MFSSFFAIFDLIAAAAFFAMWLDDRQRKYLLWWGFAHALIPLILIAYRGIVAQPLQGGEVNLYTIWYAASIGGVSVCMAVGAMCFRAIAVNGIALVAITASATFVLFMLGFISGAAETVGGTALLFSSYLIVARLLWSTSIAERVASIFFVVRAIFVIVLSTIKELPDYSVILGFAAAISAIANAVLLLIISFFKTTADLKRNLQFSDALHAITAKSRAISNGHELGIMAVDELLKLPCWVSGTLMKVSDDRKFFELICTQGAEQRVTDHLKKNSTPIAGTLSEQVVLTGKPKIWTQESINSEGLNASYKRFFKSAMRRRGIHLIVPVSNQGAIIGVLILSDDVRVKVLPQELKTLESVGEVIGAGIENLTHLRTLNYRASHDTLTGLSNRATLHDCCEKQLADSPFTLMLFDLDNFKEVNDVFGHGVGDKLLKTLARYLQQELASDVMLFRLGGDEFVVIYPKSTRFSADKLAEDLLSLIKQPLSIDKLRFECLASIGVVETETVGNDSHELLRCADLAMYKAKGSELKIAYYDKPYDKYVRERTQLLADVSQGLEKHEFELFYQPIIQSSGKSCHLCEGLLRWRHPTRGLISAADFIPIVELTEQITLLTYRVIELALSDLAGWQKQGKNISVAINLSARNFLDRNLPEYLINTSKAYGVAPAGLQLEITETVLMKDPQIAEKITHQLVAAGFTIALDDFGSGYSSLAYLARFPISTVKIDRSFVAAIDKDKRSKDIVEATIDLTHKLGYVATAEGIEGQTVEAILEDLGCDFLQGYLYSKAIEKSAFDVWYEHFQAHGI